MDNLTKSVLITIWILAIIGFVIWNSNRECGYCDSYKSIYNIEIQGKIIQIFDKFDKNASRPISYTIVQNKDNRVLNLKGIYNRNNKLGDSIFKEKKSLIIEFYRNDSLLSKDDINCNCSYVKEN